MSISVYRQRRMRKCRPHTGSPPTDRHPRQTRTGAPTDAATCRPVLEDSSCYGCHGPVSSGWADLGE